MTLPWLPFSWKHQSTQHRGKGGAAAAWGSPCPFTHHQDASVAVPVDAPELQVCLGLDSGSPGGPVDQRQLPKAASFSNAGHPLPVDIDLPQHKTKEAKAVWGLSWSSNCQFLQRPLAICFLAVSVGDTEGKQERDTSNSWSPKRGTACSGDRISSCLTSVQ